jgi:hypothetical protein
MGAIPEMITDGTGRLLSSGGTPAVGAPDQGKGAMRIGSAEIVAILIALSLIVGVVGWLYQFTRDR